MQKIALVKIIPDPVIHRIDSLRLHSLSSAEEMELSQKTPTNCCYTHILIAHLIYVQKSN